MAYNKVIYNGSTLIDLTGDTVDASTLYVGVTAHGANGEQITGTMTINWGDIRGTLSSQTDLNNALNARLSLTGGTVSGTITATKFIGDLEGTADSVPWSGVTGKPGWSYNSSTKTLTYS